MRKNTNSERIKLKVNHLNGKRTSINKVVKETAKKKQQSLGKYLEAVKGFDKEKKNQVRESENTNSQKGIQMLCIHLVETLTLQLLSIFCPYSSIQYLISWYNHVT